MVEEIGENIFITGPSGCGKSTLIGDVVSELGLKAEGLRTPDIRKNGRRKGFELLDISDGDRGVLAHVDRESGPKVSKYRVDMDDLEKFTEKALENVSEDCEILVIDEIGTMELYSGRFEKAVEERLKGDIPVLAVLHRNYVDEYQKYGEVFELDRENYSAVKDKIISILERVED